MKKCFLIIVLFFPAMLVGTRAMPQSQELAELALDIEKLAQFKQILNDLKKGYEILEGGYKTIKNISEGNFNIHKAFLDGLLAVSPTVAKYQKIVTITENQLQLIKEYKKAFTRFQKDENFNATELNYISKVYNNLVDESVKNLESLLDVLTAGKLRMSDDERIRTIDFIDEEIQNKLSFLRYFTSSTTLLALQRAKERSNLHTSTLLQGINK